jgi:hypothetical protein
MRRVCKQVAIYAAKARLLGQCGSLTGSGSEDPLARSLDKIFYFNI